MTFQETYLNLGKCNANLTAIGDKNMQSRSGPTILIYTFELTPLSKQKPFLIPHPLCNNSYSSYASFLNALRGKT